MAERAVEEYLRFPLQSDRATWQYDEEADVLYIRVAGSRPAIGFDIGHGVIIEYDEDTGEVTGLTMVGLRERFRRAWAQSLGPDELGMETHPARTTAEW